MRQFTTGATRDNDDDKPDFQGFLSPFALARFAMYMQSHQRQADGTLRASDNWKKGIPLEAYEKSMYRHMIEFFFKTEQGDFYGADEALQAIIFNALGWSHERHKPNGPDPVHMHNSNIAFTNEGIGISAQTVGPMVDKPQPMADYPSTQYGDFDVVGSVESIKDIGW
jgi:hypothetical protein